MGRRWIGFGGYDWTLIYPFNRSLLRDQKAAFVCVCESVCLSIGLLKFRAEYFVLEKARRRLGGEDLPLPLE